MMCFLDNFLDNPKVYLKKSANLLDKLFIISYFQYYKIINNQKVIP
jgi:hypothetical protein